MRIASRVRAEIDSPIGAAYALVAHRAGRRPFLDLGRAAPPVVEHVVTVARDAHGADHVGQAGLLRLREAPGSRIRGLRRARDGRTGPQTGTIEVTHHRARTPWRPQCRTTDRGRTTDRVPAHSTTSSSG